jgi:mitochondrial fission protein ELM1
MSVPYSLAVRRKSLRRTFTVQIQNPVVPITGFDLVAPPQHDHLKGANVIETRGAVHRVTPGRLAVEADKFRDQLSHLPRPLVAVLIGGDNKCYSMTPEIIRSLAAQLLRLTTEFGAGLAVTPSRRTGAENEQVLRDALAQAPAVVWDGTGDNPYFGYLGLADAVVVTCDSVSMVSEAASTGKPVYIVELAGGNRKFRDFHDMLRNDGVTRPFSGVLEHWEYAEMNDTSIVADEIKRRLKLRA